MGVLYGQDVIEPSFVGHGYDFGDYEPQTGDMGHAYNFLAYAFEEGDARAEAIHYLDEADKVTLRILEPLDFSGAFARRVLVFLTMRFGEVFVPQAAGGYAPLPAALREEIDRLRAAHMRNAAV